MLPSPTPVNTTGMFTQSDEVSKQVIKLPVDDVDVQSTAM